MEKMRDLEETQPGAQLYVARFRNAQVIVDTKEGKLDAYLNGHVLVTGERVDEVFTVTEIRQLSAWSGDLPGLGGFLDFAGPLPDAEQPLTGPEGLFTAHMYYPLLGEEKPVLEEIDAVYPFLERLQGQITLETTPASEMVLSGHLSLSLVADPVNLSGKVQAVAAEEIELEFHLLSGPGESAVHNSLAACAGAPAAGAEANYNLTLRFVSVSVIPGNQPAMAAAAHPLQGVAQAQINGACEVWWQHAGIRLVPYQVAGQLDIFEAADKAGGVSSVDDQNLPNRAGLAIEAAIEVYLVDQLLGTAVNPATGGGVSFGNRTRQAWIVLEIGKAQNNPYLLAHELGHILGLIHPGELLPVPNNNGLIHGSECSVMVPDSPMSDRNTQNNITQARALPPLGPVLEVGVGTCTLSQIPNLNFFHIVRDFPCDDGEEPSVPHSPAQYWWTHSDVWNSNQQPGTLNQYAPLVAGGAEAPMFNADHSPVHREPRRLLSNQMYVRLHTCNPLANDVDVHLFLAVPGVAIEPLTRIAPTGAGEVNPLVFDNNAYGPFVNTSRPSMGSPRYKKIAWNVPAGYPSNCCVFAAAVSANEPDGGLAAIVNDPAGHNFADLFARLKSDNDVAQRNLHIQNVLTFASNLPTTLNWLQFANPLGASGSARLEIDATQAVKLSELRLLAENGESLAIEDWQERPVTLDLVEELRPGERFDIRLQATLPAGLAEGDQFPIHLVFFIGEEMVGGFTHIIELAPLERAAFQVFDMLYAALMDSSHALESEILKGIAFEVGAHVLQYVAQPQTLIEEVTALHARLANAAAGLEESPGFLALLAASRYRAEQIQALLLQMAAILSLSGFLAAPVWLEKLRLLADQVQCIAGRLVREG